MKVAIFMLVCAAILGGSALAQPLDPGDKGETGAPLAAPQQTPTAKPMTICEALASDWRRVEQNMASRWTSDLGDNSAPRATMRAIEESNDLSIASITLGLMRDNKCLLPKRAPNVSTYLTAALSCSTARLKQPLSSNAPPAECDREKWAPGK